MEASHGGRVRRIFIQWPRSLQAVVLAVAMLVMTWLLSVLGVSPERGSLPLALDGAHAGKVETIEPDPLRLSVRVPAGKQAFALRVHWPEGVSPDAYRLVWERVMVQSFTVQVEGSDHVQLRSGFFPARNEGTGVGPFWGFSLEGARPGHPVLIHVTSDSESDMTQLVRLMPVEQFHTMKQRVAMGQAMRYACLLAMIALLFAFHLSTGEPASLSYVWFVLITLLSLLQLDGYVYLFPHTHWLGELGTSVFYAVRSLVVVASIHLALWMGQPDAPPPRLRRWVHALCWVLAALAVMQAFRAVPDWLQEPMGWLYAIGCALLLWLMWRLVRARVPLARSIYVAMGLTVIAVVAADLNDQGIIHGLWWVNVVGLSVLIVWIGLTGISLIRRVEIYRTQVIDAARHEQVLRRAAETDALTGLHNRAALDAHIRTLATADAAVSRFSAIFIDIDHFKSINDTLGHAAGDHVLREVATALRHSVRDSDRVGRYGGEEFVVLVEGAPDAEVLQLAERIRSAIATLPIMWEGKRVPVTASLGIGLPSADDATADGLMARADAAMYAAKRNGRNRIEVIADAGADDYSSATPQT